MTSLSRKSRRITAWSTAILTSLSATAFAQTPKDAPAPTTWQPYTPPAAVPKPIPTAPPVAPNVPDLPPLPTVVQPPKMVTFQKPANDARPLPVMKPRELVTPAAPATPPRVQPVVPVPVDPPRMALPVPTPPMAQPVATQPAPVVARPAVMARPQPVPAPAAPALPPTMQAPLPSLGGTVGTLPSRLQLFRLDSDATLNARIVKELGPEKSGDRFPVAQPLAPGETYAPKTVGYSPVQLLREPNYVIHRRLYFEEMNSERAGWDAGPAQAFISSAYFYRDVLQFPMKMTSGCKTPYDSSAGKCMPGDPTPYYYYPPSDITLFGGVVGATIITGTAFILP